VGQLLRIYSSSIYPITLPRIPNHLLSSLLCFTTPANTIPQQGIHIRGVWPARHNLSVVNYKTLTGLSLLRVPHFRARYGASLKVVHLYTMSTSITKCFLVSRQNTWKHTNVSKSLGAKNSVSDQLSRIDNP
jgi:hypothetical protein